MGTPIKSSSSSPELLIVAETERLTIADTAEVHASKALKKSSRLSAIFSAINSTLNSTLPIEVCQIIEDYRGNIHQEKVEGYFLKNCYAFTEWNLINGSGWDKAEAAFRGFVKEEAVDLTRIDRIDLSGLNCPGYAETRGIWASGHRLPQDRNWILSMHIIDQALTFVFQMLPELREVVAHNAPGFATSFFSIEFTPGKEKVSSLEKIDLSYNTDIQESSFKKFFIYAQYDYPKLKTVVLTGCNISPKLKEYAGKHCPAITLIDELLSDEK